jgi:hypothetical protein
MSKGDASLATLITPEPLPIQATFPVPILVSNSILSPGRHWSGRFILSPPPPAGCFGGDGCSETASLLLNPASSLTVQNSASRRCIHP